MKRMRQSARKRHEKIIDLKNTKGRPETQKITPWTLPIYESTFNCIECVETLWDDKKEHRNTSYNFH